MKPRSALILLEVVEEEEEGGWYSLGLTGVTREEEV